MEGCWVEGCWVEGCWMERILEFMRSKEVALTQNVLKPVKTFREKSDIFITNRS